MRTRKRKHKIETNIDPLMDILTATVGIILIIVLFTVIAARGKMITKNTSVKVVAPQLRIPPQGVTSKIFFCTNGKIYYFGIEEGIERMIDGINTGDLASLISMANKRNINDEYFKYKLEGIPGKNPIIILVVNLIHGSGEGLEDLEKGNPLFIKKVRQFNKKRFWIHFLVDKESFEVFNTAKEMVEEEGFSIGWDPYNISFPYRECIEGCGDSGPSAMPIIRGVNILRR